MRFQRLSERVKGQSRPQSTVEDRRPRNSCRRVCYVFAAWAASACHWNWTAVGDDQRPTEGDSRLRYTRERAWKRRPFFSLPLTKCPRNVFLFTSCLLQNNNIWLTYYALVLDAKRWLDSRLDSVLDSGAEWPGFKSQSRRCRVTVLGKLFTLIVPLFTKQQNW